MDWLVSLVLPIVVPVLTTLVIAGAKKAAEILGTHLPGNYIPAVAMAVGAMLEAVVSTQVIPGVPPAVSGAVLGLAGTGVRELVDQLYKYGPKPAI